MGSFPFEAGAAVSDDDALPPQADGPFTDGAGAPTDTVVMDAPLAAAESLSANGADSFAAAVLLCCDSTVLPAR